MLSRKVGDMLYCWFDAELSLLYRLAGVSGLTVGVPTCKLVLPLSLFLTLVASAELNKSGSFILRFLEALAFSSFCRRRLNSISMIFLSSSAGTVFLRSRNLNFSFMTLYGVSAAELNLLVLLLRPVWWLGRTTLSYRRTLLRSTALSSSSSESTDKDCFLYMRRRLSSSCWMEPGEFDIYLLFSSSGGFKPPLIFTLRYLTSSR